MQTVPWYSKDAIQKDLHLLGDEAKAGKLRVLFSVVETDSFNIEDPHHIIDDYRAEGLEIYGTTVPRPGGFISCLQTNMFFPAWQKLRAIAPDKRLEAIRDEAFRAELIDAARADANSERYARSLRWTGAGERPIYTRDRTDNLATMAAAASEHPSLTD